MGGKSAHDVMVGETVIICLPDSPRVRGKIAWSRGGAFGVQFDEAINPDTVKSLSTQTPGEGYQVPPQFRPSKDARRPGFRTNIRSEDENPPSKWL